jgi:hypothetical protein
MRVEPRVAFFPDSFAEVNGVAHTSRQLVAFAERRNLPLLCVHSGGRTERVVEGVVTKLSLRRGNIGFRLEADFRYDLFFWRHANRVIEAAREFKANVAHVTGPNDTGQLGASKRFIAMVFIKESMLVSAMGVAGGLLISLLARPALASWAGLKIEIEIGYTLCAALGGLASGLMGAIYPALRAAGQDAVEALNYK